MRLIGRLSVALAVSALAAAFLYVVFIRDDRPAPPGYFGESPLVQLAGG